MKAKRIAIDGIMAALYVVLGYLSIDLGMMKISFEEFPNIGEDGILHLVLGLRIIFFILCQLTRVLLSSVNGSESILIRDLAKGYRYICL